MPQSQSLHSIETGFKEDLEAYFSVSCQRPKAMTASKYLSN